MIYGTFDWETELAKYEIGDKVVLDESVAGTVVAKKPEWTDFGLMVRRDKDPPDRNPTGWNLRAVRKHDDVPPRYAQRCGACKGTGWIPHSELPPLRID